MLIYLPGRAMCAEVCKIGLKPTVDLAQSELPIGRFYYGLEKRREFWVRARRIFGPLLHTC